MSEDAQAITTHLGRVIHALRRERGLSPVPYTHLRAHETPEHLVCRPPLEKKNTNNKQYTLLTRTTTAPTYSAPHQTHTTN